MPPIPYDTEGNVTSTQYPNLQANSDGSSTAGPLYAYTYDPMERLTKMVDQANTTWVSGATYGPSNELLQLVTNGFTETCLYNANLELQELTSGTNVHYRYTFASQDNGQIQSQTDVISGETITYEYDSLQRLVNSSGSGDSNAGSWSQAFVYDGFGNLTQKRASNAPGLTVSMDFATNRIQTSASYDANGNMTGYSGDGYAYDVSNRMVQANPASGGPILYGYDSTNHRIYKGAYSGTSYSAEELYFYGADGHKYGTWQINPSSGVILKASVTKQWFGARLLSPEDRLESQGKYFPFGEERTNITPANPSNDQEKFATYTRDSATGLDYAGQRYFNNLIGRFMQPDPYGASGRVPVPQSWNRYAYVGNEPISANDPDGLCRTSTDFIGGWFSGCADQNQLDGSSYFGGAYDPVINGPVYELSVPVVFTANSAPAFTPSDPKPPSTSVDAVVQDTAFGLGVATQPPQQLQPQGPTIGPSPPSNVNLPPTPAPPTDNTDPDFSWLEQLPQGPPTGKYGDYLTCVAAKIGRDFPSVPQYLLDSALFATSARTVSSVRILGPVGGAFKNPYTIAFGASLLLLNHALNTNAFCTGVVYGK